MIAKWWLEKQTWHGLVFRATATDRYMLSSGIIHIICTNLYALFDSDDHNNIFAMAQNYIMSTVFLCMKPDELSERNTPSRQHNRINDKPCTYILYFVFYSVSFDMRMRIVIVLSMPKTHDDALCAVMRNHCWWKIIQIIVYLTLYIDFCIDSNVSVPSFMEKKRTQDYSSKNCL